MNVRLGFVSNSSSASFIVRKNALTEFQLAAVRNPYECAKIMDDKNADGANEWQIKELNRDGIQVIDGYTDMDNFDFLTFAQKFGIKEEDFVYDHDNFCEDEDDLGMKKFIRWIKFEQGDESVKEFEDKMKKQNEETKRRTKQY